MTNEELSAVQGSLFFVLTGALIVPEIGLNPLLNSIYRISFISAPPEWFNLAIGVSGAAGVLSSLLSIVFFRPIRCLGFEAPEPGDLDFRSIRLSDFITLWIVWMFYLLALLHQSLITQVSIFGGLSLMIGIQLIDIVARWTGERTTQSCTWSIRVFLLSIPISILVLLPFMIPIGLLV